MTSYTVAMSYAVISSPFLSIIIGVAVIKDVCFSSIFILETKKFVLRQVAGCSTLNSIIYVTIIIKCRADWLCSLHSLHLIIYAFNFYFIPFIHSDLDHHNYAVYINLMWWFSMAV